MDARDDRKTMAGMLQRTVAAARDNSGKDCPGPDLLAAYYEQALSPEERQQWEEHFSSCALCQGQLAALSRSEPQPQPGPLWFWRWHWAFKWLPPAAVALAAVAIWIAVRPNNPLRFLGKKPLEVATTAPVAPNQQDELKAMRAESPAPAAPEAASKATPSPAAIEKQRKPAGSAGPNSGLASKTRAKKESQDLTVLVSPPIMMKKAVLPPSAHNAAASGQAVASLEDKAVQGQTTVPGSAGGVPPPSPPVSASVREESPSAGIRTGGAARGTVGGAFQGTGPGLLLEARSAMVLIESPDPGVEWRISRNGIIERTTDSGKTWQGQFVNDKPGLVGGSAPSAKVCWVVGRAGTILRTTDAENWERIAPPVMIDLAGIKAKDEKAATITTTDGRAFSTQDGGKTWELVQ